MAEPLIRQTVFGVTCSLCQKPIVVYRFGGGDFIAHGIEDPDVRFYRGEWSYATHQQDYDDWMLRLHAELLTA